MFGKNIKCSKCEDSGSVGLVKNTLVLTLFSIFGKALGAVFKLPLTTIVGAEGIGIYQLVFPIFVLVFTLASSGVSTAMTIKIAECNTRSYVRMGVVCCLVLSAIMGGVVCVLAKPFALWQGNPEVSSIYYFVALAVVGVSVLNGLKAVLRGRGQLVSFAISETIEQVSKVVLALFLAFLLIQEGKSASVSGVFVAIFISTMISSCFCVIKIFDRRIVSREVLNKQLRVGVDSDVGKCGKKEFFRLSLLSTIGLVVVPVIQFVESILVLRLLQNVGYSSSDATALFGLSHGTISTLINLPSVAILSLEFVLLPFLVKEKGGKGVGKTAKHSVFLVFILCSPFVFLYLFFPSEIICTLYGGVFSEPQIEVAVGLLRIGSIGLIFAGLLQVLVVVLQGLKKLAYPPIILLLGGVVKIVSLLFLVPQLGIYGAEIAGVGFSVLSVIVAVVFLRKEKVGIFNMWIFIPLLVSGFLLFITKCTFNVVVNAWGVLFSFIVCVGVSGILYLFVMFFVFRVYSERCK